MFLIYSCQIKQTSNYQTDSRRENLNKSITMEEIGKLLIIKEGRREETKENYFQNNQAQMVLQWIYKQLNTKAFGISLVKPVSAFIM